MVEIVSFTDRKIQKFNICKHPNAVKLINSYYFSYRDTSLPFAWEINLHTCACLTWSPGKKLTDQLLDFLNLFLHHRFSFL